MNSVGNGRPVLACFHARTRRAVGDQVSQSVWRLPTALLPRLLKPCETFCSPHRWGFRYCFGNLIFETSLAIAPTRTSNPDGSPTTPWSGIARPPATLAMSRIRDAPMCWVWRMRTGSAKPWRAGELARLPAAGLLLLTGRAALLRRSTTMRCCSL